jgi:hypothetical protein
MKLCDWCDKEVEEPEHEGKELCFSCFDKRISMLEAEEEADLRALNEEEE